MSKYLVRTSSEWSGNYPAATAAVSTPKADRFRARIQRNANRTEAMGCPKPMPRNAIANGPTVRTVNFDHVKGAEVRAELYARMY